MNSRNDIEKIPDIYYDENYGKLYEQMEHGKAEIFEYKSELGRIQTQFIKREIPITIDEKQYFDLVTPYGYGGPAILECNGEKEHLVKAFEEVFRQYCKENHIVSEFVRFHPVVENALDFKEMYDATWDRHTVGTNLKDFENPTDEEFSKSCRKSIRQALRKGISFSVTKAPENIHNFKEIYYSTMDRNQASDFYYFDDTYFNQCLELYRDNILLVEAIYEEKVIAAGFYFAWDDIIHIHLSGTLSEYLFLSPAYILRYAVTLWGKENGYRMIHHGGGTSNKEDNSLYQFKKQFGKNTELDFYVGRKIWNQDIYDKLCIKSGKTGESGYFPAYREA